MSFKNRAAAITVATSLVAVPLALSGTAFAQDENPPTGYIGGTVFNDLNGDGVKQDNEPGIRDVNVSVKTPDGQTNPYSTDSYGTWTVKRAPHGQYEVSYVDPKLGNTTPSSVKAEIGAGDTPAVNFGVRAGSICGVAWNDANEDGKRQPGEGPVAGRLFTLSGTGDRFAETGADGVYCIDNLAPGDYQIVSSRRTHDPLVLTKGGTDSKFDWVTASSGSIKVGKGEQVKGVDAGYQQRRSDLKAVQLLIENGQVTTENTFRVGDTINIIGSVMANGNAPESLGGTLTVPEGLRILSTVGGLGEHAVVQGQQLIVPFGPKVAPGGAIEFAGVRVAVEKEFKGGEIKWEAKSDYVDSDLSNNVLTRKIDVLAAQPQPQGDPVTRTPEVKKTAGLANTGADPVAAGAIGLGALVLGGLAIFGARRRRSA
jgi:LPXTG-motif cell wall-anchored protein